MSLIEVEVRRGKEAHEIFRMLMRLVAEAKRDMLPDSDSF